MTPRVRNDLGAEFAWWVTAAVAVALSILLLASVADASQGATVRIRQQSCTPVSCTIGSWSGTLIGGLKDQRFAVLTCAHGYSDRSPVSIEAQPGVWIEGSVLALDARADLGLLAFTHSEWLDCATVANSPATPGTSVSVRGYPRGERYRERVTQVLRDLGSVTVVDATFISGESGGTVLAGGQLVGVIVGTDVTLPLGLAPTPGYPNGYIIPQPVVQRFVLQTLGYLPTVQVPPTDAPQPYRRREPAPALAEPDVELGPATPVLPREQPAVSPAPEQETPAPAVEVPTEIDWSLVRIVVVVPQQESLNRWDGLIRWLQGISTADVGPGATVRRYVNDITEGKVDVRIVYQRSMPDVYDRVLSEAGLQVGKFAGAVALVKRQGGGLLSPVKTLGVRLGERIAEAKLPAVPFEVLFERTNSAAFEAVNTAIDTSGAPTGNAPVGPTETVLGVIYAMFRAVRLWLGRGNAS